MLRVLFSLILFAAVWPGGSVWAAGLAFEKKSCRIFYENILGPTPEEQALFRGSNGSLYQIPEKSPAETDALNQRMLRGLRNGFQPLELRNPSRRVAVTPEVREKLFRDVMALPEVQASVCGSYQGSGKFGFCFGRALAAHLTALKSGIDKRRIRKIWAIGDLRDNGRKWKYHVSTIIQGEDGVWYAFDPSFGKILTAEEWYGKMQGWDVNQTARLYSTAAGQMFPYDWSAYTRSQLKRDLFKGFFTDLLESIKKESLQEGR